MVRRAVPGLSRVAPLRGGLLALLACASLPAFAASGFKNCDEAPAKPAELTASAAVPTETAGDHETLTVLRAEGDARNIATANELGRIIEPKFERKTAVNPLEQKRMQASALADALERRRQGQLEVPPDDIDTEPESTRSLDTALPGVGDGESLFYRREMYRTDI